MSNLYLYDGERWVEIAKNGKDSIVDYDYIFSKIPKPKDGKDADEINLPVLIESIITEIKDKKKIKVSDIAGLEDALTSYRNQLRSNNQYLSGGGISANNIYPETPSGLIDGSNTIYTVKNSINAILSFHINGEFIHPNEYTFKGKTITFTIPLPVGLSGTQFTIIYV